MSWEIPVYTKTLNEIHLKNKDGEDYTYHKSLLLHPFNFNYDNLWICPLTADFIFQAMEKQNYKNL